QVEMIWLLHQERRLGEVHLPGDCLKPVISLPGGKQADRRRIAGKWPLGEGVNVKERDGHFIAPLASERSGGAKNTSTVKSSVMSTNRCSAVRSTKITE